MNQVLVPRLFRIGQSLIDAVEALIGQCIHIDKLFSQIVKALLDAFHELAELHDPDKVFCYGLAAFPKAICPALRPP